MICSLGCVPGFASFSGRLQRLHTQRVQHCRLVPGGRTQPGLICMAAAKESMELVRTETLRDGTLLFVFGTAEEAAASKSQPEQGAESATAPDLAPEQQPEPQHPPEPVAEAAPEPVSEPTASPSHTVSTPSGSAEDPAMAFDQQAKSEGGSVALMAGPDTDIETDSDFEFSDEEGDGNGGDLSDVEFSKAGLKGLKVAQLKELCRRNDVSGFSKLKKKDLINLLLEHHAKAA